MSEDVLRDPSTEIREDFKLRNFKSNGGRLKEGVEIVICSSPPVPHGDGISLTVFLGYDAEHPDQNETAKTLGLSGDKPLIDFEDTLSVRAVLEGKIIDLYSFWRMQREMVAGSLESLGCRVCEYILSQAEVEIFWESSEEDPLEEEQGLELIMRIGGEETVARIIERNILDHFFERT